MTTSTHIRIDCDTRAAVWRNGGFTPRSGSRELHGSDAVYRPNAHWRETGSVQAARLFVGFNVGPKPKYKLDDLVAIVRRIRTRQTGDPSSTFVTQRGLYKHKRGKTVVDEDGAQVIILNTMGTPTKTFERQMERLAGTIADELEQEEVVVELQIGGMTKLVMGVGSEDAYKRKGTRS